jgi:hypothetical protein
MQYAKTLRFAIATAAIGAVIAVLFTLATVQLASRNAEATPVLAKGQPCNACHQSSRPSKSDLKK